MTKTKDTSPSGSPPPPPGIRKLVKEKERDTDNDNQASADTMATLKITTTAKAKANSFPSSPKEVAGNHLNLNNPPTLDLDLENPLPAAAAGPDPDPFLTPPTRPTTNSSLSSSLSLLPSKESGVDADADADADADEIDVLNNNYSAAGKRRKLAKDIDAEEQTSVHTIKQKCTDSDDDSVFEVTVPQRDNFNPLSPINIKARHVQLINIAAHTTVTDIQKHIDSIDALRENHMIRCKSVHENIYNISLVRDVGFICPETLHDQIPSHAVITCLTAHARQEVERAFESNGLFNQPFETNRRLNMEDRLATVCPVQHLEELSNDSLVSFAKRNCPPNQAVELRSLVLTKSVTDISCDVGLSG